MNKKQIKAELRRSACEDWDPLNGCGHDALMAAQTYSDMAFTGSLISNFAYSSSF